MATQLSTGLRNGMIGNNSYPTNLITGATYAFGDGTGADSADQIIDSGAGLLTDGFDIGQYVSVAGSTSNNFEGLKVLLAVAGALDVPAGSFTTEAEGDPVVLGSGAGGGSLDELLRNGVIEIYSGSQPATADLAESGTKLLRITQDSAAFSAGAPANGLNLGTPTSGATSKETAEVWSGVGLADGTAGWFRYYANDYTTGASSSAVRFDGVCGVGTGQLRMSSLTVTTSATTTVDSGSLTMPASA